FLHCLAFLWCLISFPTRRSSDLGMDNATDVLGSGKLTVHVGEQQLDLDLSDASLTDIRDAINANGKEMGLSATIVTDPSGASGSRLVLSSDTSGTGNDISVAVTADDPTAELQRLAF